MARFLARCSSVNRTNSMACPNVGASPSWIGKRRNAKPADSQAALSEGIFRSDTTAPIPFEYNSGSSSLICVQGTARIQPSFQMHERHRHSGQHAGNGPPSQRFVWRRAHVVMLTPSTEPFAYSLSFTPKFKRMAGPEVVDSRCGKPCFADAWVPNFGQLVGQSNVNDCMCIVQEEKYCRWFDGADIAFRI